MTKLILLGVIGLIVVFGLIDLYLYSAMESASAGSLGALESLESCRKLALQLESSKKSPSTADKPSEMLSDIASYVEKAAVQAELPPESIVYIEPGPVQPVEGSALLQQSIRLEVDGIPLLKLGKLLRNLETGTTPLGVKALRVSESRIQGNGELWRCEITLTQSSLASKAR
ncbi:hypothetical protein K2Y11_15185 [bacterium]|nr:hypothetical protein [bacterium]